jgi:hypothetical protein
VTGSAITQAAFDPRILNLPLLGTIADPVASVDIVGSKLLLRGYIKQANSLATDGVTIYGCAFLYNPTTIQATHSLDSSTSALVLPQYQRSPADTGTYLVGLATTLSWSILYDRTYEVNMISPTGAFGGVPLGTAPAGSTITTPNCSIPVVEDPRLLGVLADVRALYRVCGITNPVAGVPLQATSDGGNGTTTLTGVMQQVPAYVYFGADTATNSLSYYGYVSGINIEYTHFTQDMTPMRCAIDLTMTLLPSTS